MEYMEYYDATKLDAFASCPRKFWWRYVEKIEPIASPLWKPWGRAIHKGLESLYTYHSIDLAVAEFDVAWAESQGEEDKTHTGEGGVSLLRAYHKHYFPERYYSEVTEVKMSAILNVPEDILYLGYVDLLARDLLFPGLILLDHKTAGKRPATGITEVNSPQLTGYVWLAEQSTGERPKAYLNYLINTKVPQFERLPLAEGGAAQQEQWKENVVAQVRAIRRMQSFEEFYQARGSCSFFGKCEFDDLCCAPKGQRLKLISEFYQPKKGRGDGKEE